MKCRGMTLLEVMLALVILSVAGLALMRSGAEQNRHLQHMEQRQLALWVAENQAVRLRLAKSITAGSEHTLATEMAGRPFIITWSATATSSPNVVSLHLRVRSPGPSQPLLYDMSFLHSS
ncbi:MULTISPECIES: type II secretion system minor pseudopilin GspI [Mangrovibacter]|uniref:Type II secretion system protein I n=1 Tax=Mangrovibacter plantisponsor TaxID=451513 RepID=A0A317PUI6_9ENTR|nr:MULTISPECIES: type II secretion system minor pseudopilin GspI [Mangrovibacter]KEA52369.1 hypothetical protein DT73_15890 [Mangrovibacter sp. MFB070]PWW02660.1 general secretion pathway protein I [Mangrovibacter plantisponsor]